MGNFINFFDGYTSESVPIITQVDRLYNFADDAEFEAAIVGAPLPGNIYYNTTSERIRYYTLDHWDFVPDGITFDALVTLVNDHIAASTGVHGVTGSVVGTTDTQTLTNKTINSDSNTMIINADEATVSNIEVDNLKAGVIDADLSDGTSASDDTIPSAKATKTYVDAHINDATDAHDGSAITNTPAGNIASTDVQSAINELDTDKLDKTGGTISSDLIITGDLTVNGTTTSVNSDTLDVTDSNITVNNGGTQAAADLNDAGITVEMSDATDAIIGYDSTTTSKFNIGEIGSESEIITATHTQTVSNKTIDSSNTLSTPAIIDPTRLDVKKDTDSNLVTYASSATNGQFVFATDTKIMYQIVDNALVPADGGASAAADVIYTPDGTKTIDSGSTNVQTAMGDLDNESDNVRTTTGTTKNSTDMGTFTGAIIPDNVSIQAGMQSLETAQETHATNTTTHGVSGSIVGTTDTQDLSNKTITDALTMEEQGSTPSNPAAGDKKIYPKTDGKMYSLDSAGNEVELGSGSGGSGGINYIENGNYEDDTTGTTGDTNLVVSQETVAPLRGSGSLNIAKSAVDASTQAVTIPFTIDTADLAKKLTGSFDYDFSDANYSDGDMRVEITQDPAGAPVTIRVNGEDIKAGKGTHYFQFQTDHTELDYRIDIVQVSTQSSTVDAIIDNVKVGPTNLAFGTIITDWESFTPTYANGGTTSYNEGFQRRVGDSVEIKLTAKYTAAGAAGSVGWNIQTDLGLTPDTAKITSASNNNIIGTGHWYDDSGGQGGSLDPQYVSADSIRFIRGNGNSNDLQGTDVANNDVISFNMSIPIEGWSSNTQMSEDLGGREIVASTIVDTPVQATIGGSYAGSTALRFTTMDHDTVAMYDTATGIVTIPESGFYEYDIKTLISGSTVTNRFVAIYVGVDGSAVYQPFDRLWNTSTASLPAEVTHTQYFNKGEKVDFRVVSNITSPVISSAGLSHSFSFKKMSSPQTILETETVALKYKDVSGQTVTNNTLTTVSFDTLSYDSHNSFSTDTTTIPTTGFYSIKARILFADSAAWENAESARLFIYVNGVETDLFQRSEIQATGNVAMDIAGSTDLLLNKGDTVDVRVIQNSDSSISLSTTANANAFSLHRIK